MESQPDAAPEGAELFRRLVENAADGVAIMDADGTIRYSSPAARRLFGYDRTGHVAFESIHPDDAERARALLAGLLQEPGAILRPRLRFRGADGAWRSLDLVAQNLLEDPVVQGVVINWRDATEQAAAAEALRASEERFRAIFETALDGIVIIDDERRYVDANPAACALYGVGREELVGRSIGDFTDPPERASAAWSSLHEHGVLASESTLARPDGTTREVELRVRAGFLPGRHLAVVRDVTERNALEAELIRSQRLEAVGRLAGGIAHDFNNLLTTVCGYTDFLLAGLSPDDPLRQDAQEIARAADRATTLVRQLLAFGRRQTVRPQVVELNELVAEVEAMLRRVLGEHVVLEVGLDPGAGTVRVDPAQIEQVVLNLAMNARDAMPGGGRLTIATAGATLDAGHARLLEIEPGTYAMLAVEDTGAGMDDDTRAQAFEPFFTTKEVGSGTGLGLPSVFGTIRQSGGAVELESEPGRGTAVRIYLPRVGAAAAEPVEPAVPGHAAATVLLVEDEAAVRRLAERVLAASGYTVLAATGGREALELAERHEGPIDLLLTDVVMPGMGGLELAERLRLGRPGLRVVYTSGYGGDASLLPGAAAEGAAFLPKPFSPATLAYAARTALERRTQGPDGGA